MAAVLRVPADIGATASYRWPRSADELPARGSLRAGPAAWRSILDRRMGASRVATLHRLASDLAEVHERCREYTRDPQGQQRLPDMLDRELRVLSVRLTAGLNATFHAILERALTAVLKHPLTLEVFTRAAEEVRTGCTQGPEQVFLVTSTAGVATVRGAGAQSVRSVNRLCTGPIMVQPVRITLTAGCYLLWRRRVNVHPMEANLWLQRALDSVAAVLLDELVTLYHNVHGELTVAVGELALPGDDLTRT